MRRFRNVVALVVAGLSVGGGFASPSFAASSPTPTIRTPHAETPHAETQRRLDALVSTSPGAPGGEVVAGNRSGTWSLRTGTAQVRAERPFKPSDHVHIGSYTKTFVATVVLQLVAEGKVELDAPVERYLPGVIKGNGYDGTKVTVRHVLQQTSGIADYLTPTPVHRFGLYNPALHRRTWKLTELIANGLAEKPHFAPGAKWEYSNTNYIIAGLLIERVTGNRVSEVVTDRIIRRFGLTHTSYPEAGQKAMPTPHAYGYIGTGSVRAWLDVTESLNEPSYLSSAGTMMSTPADMMAFAQRLADGKALPAKQWAEMRDFLPITVDQKLNGYGLGLYQLKLSCGGEAIGHYGATAGFGEATMATADGRHVTVVINSPIPALGAGMTGVVDSALCGTK